MFIDVLVFHYLKRNLYTNEFTGLSYEVVAKFMAD